MKTRVKKLSDYGISEERGKELMEYCYTSGESTVVKRAAEQANPALASLLVKSLTEKLSYDKLMKKYFVPIGACDFYAYRRKMLAILNDLLRDAA